MTHIHPSPLSAPDTQTGSAPAGYDPELLFVECAKCGSPVLWQKGQAAQILQNACIDPLELDEHCLLLTDGCPRCSSGKVFTVQVARVQHSHFFQGDVKEFGNA